MAMLGEIIIAILTEITSSIIDTSLRLIMLVAELFNIVGANYRSLSTLHLMLLIFIVSAITFGVFKLIKGDIKHLIIAFVLLTILSMLLMI